LGLGNPALTWSGYTPAVFSRNVVVVDATLAPSRGAWWGGKPCAADVDASANCTWDLGDSFAHTTVQDNIWFNRTAIARETSTFPGGCPATDHSCGTADPSGCACRSWSRWTATGQDTGSRWLDPQLTGPLQLVTARSALALGIEPLAELAGAGADWAL